MEEINETLLKSILRNRTISTADKNEAQEIVSESNLYEPPQGAQSNGFFYKVHDHRVEEEASKCLFMKVSKAADNMESYNFSMFFNETYFYSKIAPFFQTFGDFSSFVQNYLGSSLNLVGSTEKCAMVGENLQSAGYQHRRPNSRWDYPHLALVLQKIGELHAFSYKAKTLERKHFFSLVANLTNNMEYTVVLVVEMMLKRNMLDILEHISHDKRFVEDNAASMKKTEYMVENMLTELQKQLTVDPDADENLVLCHGDSNPMNFMFKYENGVPTKVKFFDFANCQLGSPTLDVIYFLYTATDEKMRLEHWDDLIDVYYSALSGAFTDIVVPAKSSILNDFPLQAWYPGLIGINWAPYLMAIDDIGENIPENIPLTNIPLVTKNRSAERASIFKDMVRRNFI